MFFFISLCCHSPGQRPLSTLSSFQEPARLLSSSSGTYLIRPAKSTWPAATPHFFGAPVKRRRRVSKYSRYNASRKETNFFLYHKKKNVVRHESRYFIYFVQTRKSVQRTVIHVGNRAHTVLLPTLSKCEFPIYDDKHVAPWYKLNK